MNRLKKVQQVLFYTLLLNLAVASAKIVYGYITNSISMLSDGFHSLFDGTSNVIGLVGIYIASKPPDKNHPYGHRKFETLSTIGIAVLIFITGIEILRKAYFGFTASHEVNVTPLSFAIMAVTLSINIGVMAYETRKGRELKSDFLLADAIHTKSDIFVSISVVISLVAAKLGYSLIDAVTAVVIAIMIGIMGIEILRSATNVLTDASCLDADEIKEIIAPIKGVKGCHEIRTRGKEGAVHIDLHILVDPDAKTQETHEVSHSVEEALKKKFPSVIDVVIHTEPFDHNKKDPENCQCIHEDEN